MSKLDRYNFRFWDKDFGYKYRALGDMIPTTKYRLDEYEQCTGLEDKNGRLIFEGDIVAKEFQDRPFSSKAKSKIKNCLVCWNESGEFSIKFKSDKYRFYSVPYDSFVGDCEIVGNIHENPELLED